MRTAAFLLCIFNVACGSSAEVPSDSRCVSLCVDPDPSAACDLGVERCETRCNARVEGLSSLCSACLLEGGARGDVICIPGETCCAAALEFPGSVLSCAASCEGEVGPDVRDPDPRCDALCGRIEAGACDAERTACFSECQDRIRETAGLCATCLLEGARVSAAICLPGEPCCPAGLEFGRGVEECSPVCVP